MISRIDSILFCFLFSIVTYGADRKVVLFSNDRNPKLNENALSAENMIFEIRSIYNLNKKALHLGRNSIIDVRKGGLRNGTIVMASNTSIIGDLENDESGTLKINVAGKNINISDYIDILEYYFYSFENSLYLAEQRKKDEERINGFNNSLHDDFLFDLTLKKKIEKKYGKPIDFKKINHINELSNIVDNKLNNIIK